MGTVISAANSRRHRRRARRSAVAVVLCLLAGVFTASASFAGAEECLQPSGDLMGTADRQAIASAPGPVVRLCEGTFHINSTVDITEPGTTLVGAGQGKTVIRATPITHPFARLCGASTHPMIEVNARPEGSRSCAVGPAPGVEVSGLTLDGAGSLWAHEGIKTWQNGWGSADCEPGQRPTLRVHDVHIRDLTKRGAVGVSLGNVCDVVVEGNRVTNIDSQDSGVGVSVTTIEGGSETSRSEQVRVEGNHIDSVGGRGIACATPLDEPGNDVRHLLIRSNTVTGVREDDSWGIELWNACHHAVVEDNELDQGISVVRSDAVAIRGNQIIDRKPWADGFAGIETGGGDDVIASDNVVDSGVAHGLVIEARHQLDTSRVALLRNNVTNATRHGLWILGDHHDGVQSRVSNVYVGGGHCSGALPGTTVRCGFSGALGVPEGNGVLFGGVVEHVVVEDVRIASNVGYGIKRDGAGLDHLAVLDSEVRDNVRGGVNWTSRTAPRNLWWFDNACATRCPDEEWAAWNPPSPRVAMPTRARVGEPVAFSGGDTGTSQLWDLGSGSPRTESGTITYDKPGTYVVSLVVWGSNGQGAVAGHTITID